MEKSINKPSNETSNNSSIRSSESSKLATKTLVNDSCNFLPEPQSSKITIEPNNSDMKERYIELQNFQEANLAALAIAETQELSEELQSEVPDPSSSITVERQKKILDEFANLVASATPKQFEVLERTVLSLPEKLKAVDVEEYFI